MKQFAVLLMVAATMGCRASAPDQVAATGAKDGVALEEAQKAFDDTVASYAKGDAVAIMERYADGASQIDAGHPEPTTDRNLQTQWATEFVAMKPSDLIAKPAIQPLGPDQFVASGTASFLGDVGPGRTLVHYRFTQVYRRMPGQGWKIVHEHVSLPPEEPAAAAPVQPR